MLYVAKAAVEMSKRRRSIFDGLRPSPGSSTSPPISSIPRRCSTSPSSAKSPPVTASCDNTLDDAFGQRIVSTIYTTLQQYHVILEVDPKFQYGPEALNGIYVKSSSGQQVPISTLVDSVITLAPLVINHQGQFPSVMLSFNLAPGTALGQAVSAIQKAAKELGPPLSLQTSFQGNAQAFGASLKSTPILIAAAPFVIYLILGILLTHFRIGEWM
jgi:multidrug efflux pump subunit AcrB